MGITLNIADIYFDFGNGHIAVRIAEIGFLIAFRIGRLHIGRSAHGDGIVAVDNKVHLLSHQRILIACRRFGFYDVVHAGLQIAIHQLLAIPAANLCVIGCTVQRQFCAAVRNHIAALAVYLLQGHFCAGDANVDHGDNGICAGSRLAPVRLAIHLSLGGVHGIYAVFLSHIEIDGLCQLVFRRGCCELLQNIVGVLAGAGNVDVCQIVQTDVQRLICLCSVKSANCRFRAVLNLFQRKGCALQQSAFAVLLLNGQSLLVRNRWNGIMGCRSDGGLLRRRLERRIDQHVLGVDAHTGNGSVVKPVFCREDIAPVFPAVAVPGQGVGRAVTGELLLLNLAGSDGICGIHHIGDTAGLGLPVVRGRRIHGDTDFRRNDQTILFLVGFLIVNVIPHFGFLVAVRCVLLGDVVLVFQRNGRIRIFLADVELCVIGCPQILGDHGVHSTPLTVRLLLIQHESCAGQQVALGIHFPEIHGIAGIYRKQTVRAGVRTVAKLCTAVKAFGDERTREVSSVVGIASALQCPLVCDIRQRCQNRSLEVVRQHDP